MASGPTLPPQAYTREILTAAFNWLQTQPDSVRKLATTPDALVGLYMRAQRFGNSSLEADAPVSSQNFMSDLKNLAEGLKQFEASPERQQERQPEFRGDSRIDAQDPRNGVRNDLRADLRELRELRRTPGAQAPMQMNQPSPPPMPQQMPPPPPPANLVSRDVATMAAITAVLNDRSVAMIQDVKTAMNLSSDAEALNMMISLAYKSLKNLIV